MKRCLNGMFIFFAGLLVFFSASTSASAQSVLIDWNPAWNSDWGAAKQPALNAATGWITLQKDSAGDTVMMRDGREFVTFGTGVNNASDAIGANSSMTDADMKATIRRIAALGHNTLRIMGQCTKSWAGSTASNYGCWASTSGADMSEAFMSAMDREIAYANQMGLQVWFVLYTNNTDGSSYVARAYPGLPVVSQNYYGMQWSDTYRQYFKEYASRFTDRINTATGVRYIDNPGIMWQTDNEAGFSYAYFSGSREGYMDGLITADENTNPWTKELHTKTRNYFAAKGWTLPGNKFPLNSTYNGWSSADKQHLMSFISDTEEDYAREMSQWFKAKNPKVLVDIATFNYQSGRQLNYSDLTTHHNYSRAPSGDPITNPPNYQTRTSILKDNNGYVWSWAMGGSRLERTPYVQTETGDYGFNRWDYERDPLEAIVGGLQKTSGFVVFNESQALTQAKATGIQYIHHHPGWPSRELSVLLAAPIMEYRFVSPLPAKYVGNYSDSEYLSAQMSAGKAAVSPWFSQSNSDGSERGYWSGRIYMGFNSTGADVGSYPKVTDAQFAAGYKVPTVAGETIYASTKGVTVSTPYVAGLVNDLKNTTIGPLTLSGVSAMENAVVMIRSDAKYPLFSGPAKFFAFSHSTNTDAGFDDSADGDTVTSWGSQSATRLRVPNPFTVTFATGGIQLDVLGVNDDGTTVALPTTVTGSGVQFTTDTRFPVYVVKPKGQSTTPTPGGSTPTSAPPTPTATAGKAGDANGDTRVDGQDYVIWLSHYGSTTSRGAADGDYNGDGTVGGQDYVVWLNNYGR